MLRSEKHFINGKQKIALVTVIVSTVALLADYVSYFDVYSKAQALLVAFDCLCYASALILFIASKRKLYRITFAITTYATLLNLLLAPIFFETFYPNFASDSTIIFGRDLFILTIYLCTSAFIIGRVHILIQFFLSILLIVFYSVFTEAPHIQLNLSTYILALIGLTIVLFFVLEYTEIFIAKITEANAKTQDLFANENKKNLRLQQYLNAHAVLSKEVESNLSESHNLSGFGKNDALMQVCTNVVTVVALTMETNRVSIWFFSAGKDKLIRYVQFENHQIITAQLELSVLDYPVYFDAINSKDCILANEAANNNLTKEFKASYLDAFNIRSMLDCPILVNGKIIGIICCEQQQVNAQWGGEEVFFVDSMADFISINLQNQTIAGLFANLKEKNREIIDSINYAKRIQTAILPSDKMVARYMNHSFIIYKPKDIIAGDFYWLEAKDDLIYFAAADCTGHGVPGALISVICFNALNRSVREYKLDLPGEILDKTRELVLEQFSKSHEDVKDGMDISLCVLNTKTKELKWSGANNPLWIVRNNALIVVKPDKQPIGQYRYMKPFSSHEIQLEVNDNLYIFTDGYADQFGGSKDKKFKTSAMKSMLLQLQDKTMYEQKQVMNQAFEEWKGDNEQIDDVCVIGLRI
jgi:serine phosphatase RsbU (regulator of sigma subunit)